MARQKKNKKNDKNTNIDSHVKNIDIIFNFKDVEMSVVVDNAIYDEEEIKHIVDIVDIMSKNISIDKSYVDFPRNKHQDTFMNLEGWNDLCDTIIASGFTKYIRKMERNQLLAIYNEMISTYMYKILEIYEYDTEYIDLCIKEGTFYQVSYEIDTIHEWKYYKGSWKDWNI